METPTFIQPFGVRWITVLFTGMKAIKGTCHSRVVYNAICLPNRDIGLIYICKDGFELTFLALNASLDLFPQDFSQAN